MILLDIVVETGQDIEDEQARAYYYMACVEYGAYGREPDQESMPDSIRVAWRLTKDALDHSRAKAEAGRIGGKQSGSKRKANAKQTRSKDEANAKPVTVTVTEEIKPTPQDARAREGAVEDGPFVPPTVEEVRAYAFSCGYGGLDAQRFVDHYSALGWMCGKTPIRDWRPKLHAWGQEDRRRAASGPQARQALARAPDDLAAYR